MLDVIVRLGQSVSISFAPMLLRPTQSLDSYPAGLAALFRPLLSHKDAMNRHIYSLFAGCLLALTALQPLLHAQPRYDKALIQSEIERHESSLRRTPSGTASTTALDVKYYRLDLVITTTPQYLKGSVLMNALSTQNGLGSISLDLMSSMTIDSVTVGGAQASFAQLATSFNVTLDRNYDAGELMSVEVFYRGKPGSSGFGSFAFSAHSSTPWVWSLSEPYGAKDWWPCNDHPSDKADSVDIIIRCDSAYKVGSNGKLLAVTDNGDGTDTYRWHEGYPISTYLVSVAITNYAEFSNWFKYTPTDSMEILNYVLPEHLSSAVSQLPRVVDELRIYSDLFGLYPFINEKYGHSEFGWGGGMEHQTMTSLGGFSEYLTAHELAHQWFGDMITCRTWPDIWLNEGFATFCELLYEREQYGEATYLNGMLSDMADAKTSTRSLYVSDSGSVGSLFSWSRVYAKGSVVLHMLRRVLGDSIFFQAMYNYANDPRFRFATASTGDFQEVCESTSAMSLGYFFNEWVYGERYPRYTTSWTADSIGSGYVVTIGVRQTTLTLNPPFFTMPVDFKMIAPGWDTTVTLMNNAQEQSFAVMSSHRPVSVVLDPGRWILCDKDTLRAYAAAPAAISMGDVFVFGFKSDSIIVTNPGLVALNITSAATDDPVFTVSPASATIAASASRAFVVTFHPTLSGARSAHLYLAHNAAQSPGVVNISGRAIGYTIANRWNLFLSLSHPRIRVPRRFFPGRYRRRTAMRGRGDISPPKRFTVASAIGSSPILPGPSRLTARGLPLTRFASARGGILSDRSQLQWRRRILLQILRGWRRRSSSGTRGATSLPIPSFRERRTG